MNKFFENMMAVAMVEIALMIVAAITILPYALIALIVYWIFSGE